MHVAEIKKNDKGKLHVTTLVRRTFREERRVRHETISNISGLPHDLIESIKLRFKTGLPLVGADEQFTIERSLPHGNVAAVLGTMKKLGMEKLLAHRPCRERQLVLAMIAMIADRILSPGSKLSCSNGLCAATAQNTLAEELKLGDVDVHELYDAMDWLLDAQPRIESKGENRLCVGMVTVAIIEVIGRRLCTDCCVIKTGVLSRWRCFQATRQTRLRSRLLWKKCGSDSV